jgi:DNA-binding NtrC family response regulator
MLLLVVDDDNGLIAAIRRYDGRNGVNIITASADAEALEMLARKPDAALIDMCLAGGGSDRSGVQLALHIVTTPTLHTGVVLMSGYEIDPRSQLALYSAGIGNLVKPLPVQDLLFAAHLAWKRRTDPAAVTPTGIDLAVRALEHVQAGLDTKLKLVCREAVTHALAKTKGNVSHAADLLSVNRSFVQRHRPEPERMDTSQHLSVVRRGAGPA